MQVGFGKMLSIDKLYNIYVFVYIFKLITIIIINKFFKNLINATLIGFGGMALSMA